MSQLCGERDAARAEVQALKQQLAQRQTSGDEAARLKQQLNSLQAESARQESDLTAERRRLAEEQRNLTEDFKKKLQQREAAFGGDRDAARAETQQARQQAAQLTSERDAARAEAQQARQQASTSSPVIGTPRATCRRTQKRASRPPSLPANGTGAPKPPDSAAGYQLTSERTWPARVPKARSQTGQLTSERVPRAEAQQVGQLTSEPTPRGGERRSLKQQLAQRQTTDDEVARLKQQLQALQGQSDRQSGTWLPSASVPRSEPLPGRGTQEGPATRGGARQQFEQARASAVAAETSRGTQDAGRSRAVRLLETEIREKQQIARERFDRERDELAEERIRTARLSEAYRLAGRPTALPGQRGQSPLRPPNRLRHPPPRPSLQRLLRFPASRPVMPPPASAPSIYIPTATLVCPAARCPCRSRMPRQASR